MVTYRRETNQWRDMNPWQRAMMIRDDADIALTACEMQHRRIVDYRQPLPGDLLKSATLRGRVDVDFFVIALNRLLTVAQLTRKVADPRNVLPAAMETFGKRTAGLPLSDMEPHEDATVTGVRHAFEHGQNLERRSGLGMASGQDGWSITYLDPDARPMAARVADPVRPVDQLVLGKPQRAVEVVPRSESSRGGRELIAQRGGPEPGEPVGVRTVDDKLKSDRHRLPSQAARAAADMLPDVSDRAA